MVGLLNESSEGIMDKLDNELGDIVDRQLRELGFINLCSRIANKLVEKVQQIDDDHHVVKRTINDIEQQLNLLLSDKEDPGRGPELIVIDDEEDSPRATSPNNAGKFQQSDKRGPPFGKDGASAAYPSEVTPRTPIVSARTSVPSRFSVSISSHSRTSLSSGQTETALRTSLPTSVRSNTATVSSVSSKTFHAELMARLTSETNTVNKMNNVTVSSSTSPPPGRGSMLPQERPQPVSSIESSSPAQIGSKRTSTGKEVTTEPSPIKTGTTYALLGKTFTSPACSEKLLSPPTPLTLEKQNANRPNIKTTPPKTSPFSSSGFRAFTTASSPKSSVAISSTSPLAKKKILPAVSQSLGDLTFSYASSVPNYASYWPQTPNVPFAKKHTSGIVNKPLGAVNKPLGAVNKPVGNTIGITKNQSPSVASAGTQTSGSSLQMKRQECRMFSIGNMGSLTAPPHGPVNRPILPKPGESVGFLSYSSSTSKPLTTSVVSSYTSTSPPTAILSSSPTAVSSVFSHLASHTESDNDTGSASETTGQPGIEEESSEQNEFESDELEFTKKPKRILKFVEGMQILAKPEKSDIWYQGNIIKTYLTKTGQEKFNIKFGCSQKIANLTVNHLAPLIHPDPEELRVGSRVVAGRPSDTVDDRLRNKYKEISTGTKTDILFGGIVAEIACEETRNRYLIFFDDGFAAYCSLKKLHLVIFSSIKVWEDVAIHCREFVKEYLEEYPDRPMVKLKTGQIVNTEWNGRWLKARVLSVDGSLVKMLFDIDRRSEWIYRGSTRLEPLYTELDRRDREREQAKSKSKSAAAATKRRRTARGKKNTEPFIEDMITKPSFGVSRLSKTDPEGIQQNREWEAELQMKANEEMENAAKDKPPKDFIDFESNDNLSPAVVEEEEEMQAVFEPKKIEENTSHTSSQTRKDKEQLSEDYQIDKELEDVKEDTTKKEENKNFDCELESQPSSPFPLTSAEDCLAQPQKTGRFSRQSSTSSRSSTASLSKSSAASHPKLAPSTSSPLAASASALPSAVPPLPSAVSPLPSAVSPLPSTASPLPSTYSPSPFIESQPVVTPESPDSDSSLPSLSKVTRIETKSEAKPSVMPFSGSLEGAEENWEAPWLKRKRRLPSQSRNKIKIPPPRIEEKKSEVKLNEQKGIASRLQEKLQQQQTLKNDVVESPTKDVEQMLLMTQTFPRIRGPHKCSSCCVPDSRIPAHEIGKHNILSIPLLLGWTRETAKRRPGYRRDIYYRTPCNRRLRNMLEITQYLLETRTTNVTIDQFSFDSSISCRDQSPILKPRAKIDDLSHGKEKVPIQCVNEKNSQYPPVVEYISRLIVADGIRINFDPGYLACCDCTDFCQDKKKCSCQRLTVASSDAIDGQEDESACYEYRRLKDCITTGIYECNQNCSCGPSCFNRIVQHGIRLRLQVFMTDSKGWGLRCLDDIPRGSFVCTYVGQILNEEMANKEGTDFGDEYLAELDHIEVVEQAKEGYESDVPELRDERNSNSSASIEGTNEINSKGDESESDESEYSYSTITSSSAESDDDDDAPNQKKPKIAPLLLRRQKSGNSSGESETLLSQHDETWCAITKASKGDLNTSSTLIDLTLDSSETDDEDEDKNDRDSASKIQSSLEVMIAKLKSRVKEEKDKPISGLLVTPTSHRVRQADTAEGSNADDTTREALKKRRNSENSDSESNEDGSSVLAKQLTVQLSNVKLLDNKGQGSSSQELPRQSSPFRAVARKTTRSALQRNVTPAQQLKGLKAVKTRAFAYKSTGGLGYKTAGILGLSGRTFTSPRISTGGHFARKAMAARFQAALQGTPASQQQQQLLVEEKEQTPEKKGTRNLYGERNCYVVDAKSFGNVGRYLNHSCSPNLFVQNVFIETHDLRFPVVAFFAQQNVPALTELTWDYSYDVGSVPGKELQCHCGSSECRGRLL